MDMEQNSKDSIEKTKQGFEESFKKAAYYDMLDLARQQGADELNTWANKAYQEAKAAMEN